MKDMLTTIDNVKTSIRFCTDVNNTMNKYRLGALKVPGLTKCGRNTPTKFMTNTTDRIK